MLFGKDHAGIYDLVYTARGKDYAGETATLIRLIRERVPHASTLLDVACGTGGHLRHFKDVFEQVEGLEMATAMRERAHEKLPDVVIHSGDMRFFQLGRSFDVVTCLYSSVAYLPLAELKVAVATMARHLHHGGVLVVEPWWLREDAIDGQVDSDLIHGEGLTVAKMSIGRIQQDTHRLTSHFLVGDADGVRHFSDTQVLGLYHRQDYLDAFTEAGCEAEYFPGGLTGRGLLVGVRRR